MGEWSSVVWGAGQEQCPTAAHTALGGARLKVFEGSRGTFFKKSALVGFGGRRPQGLALSGAVRALQPRAEHSMGGAHQELCEAVRPAASPSPSVAQFSAAREAEPREFASEEIEDFQACKELQAVFRNVASLGCRLGRFGAVPTGDPHP